jgi:hypothetical protein
LFPAEVEKATVDAKNCAVALKNANAALAFTD